MIHRSFSYTLNFLIGGVVALAVSADLGRCFGRRLVLVSPPRTASTLVARLLWEHPDIGYHCHEPFEAMYWGQAGEESVAANFGNPMEVSSGDRISIACVPPGRGVLLKEMSFQLDSAQFDLLAGLATAPVIFVMRDPVLSTVSRLRIVRELSGRGTFPPFESGWLSLSDQVARCRKHGVPYVLVDSGDLRADPRGLAQSLFVALGMTAPERLGVWQPRPGLRLCAPEVGSLMGSIRAADDPFYRRVLASEGIEAPDTIDSGREFEVIKAAGLAAEVTAWRQLHLELRKDPHLLTARGDTARADATAADDVFRLAATNAGARP